MILTMWVLKRCKKINILRNSVFWAITCEFHDLHENNLFWFKLQTPLFSKQVISLRYTDYFKSYGPRKLVRKWISRFEYLRAWILFGISRVLIELHQNILFWFEDKMFSFNNQFILCKYFDYFKRYVAIKIGTEMN